MDPKSMSRAMLPSLSIFHNRNPNEFIAISTQRGKHLEKFHLPYQTKPEGQRTESKSSQVPVDDGRGEGQPNAARFLL